MAEETQKPAEGEATTQIQPQIIVHTQYVKDFSFENPKAPQSLMASDTQPKIEIGINVGANPQGKPEDRQFEVVLTINAAAKTDDDNIFIAELAYAAVMSIDKAVEERHIHPMVMIEGPRMVFPFARQFLSMMTQAGGFMPLNLQPIDFVRIYQAGLEQQRAQQAASGDATGGEAAPAVENKDGNGAAGDAASDDKKAAKKKK